MGGRADNRLRGAHFRMTGATTDLEPVMSGVGDGPNRARKVQPGQRTDERPNGAYREARLGFALQECNPAIEPARRERVIGRQEHEVVAGGLVEPLVGGRDEATILLMTNHAYATVQAREFFHELP